MNNDQIKDLLEKQLLLLSEISKEDLEIEEFAQITGCMVTLAIHISSLNNGG